MIRTLARLAAFVTVLAPVVSYGQSFAPPAQDYVLHFGGLSVAYTDQISLGSAFTMETWLYLDAASPGSIIMGKPNNPASSDPSQHYVLGFQNNGQRPIFVQSTGQPGSTRTITATSDIPLRTWTHVAATLGAGVMSLYVNGHLVASGNSPGTPAGAALPFSLGRGLLDGLGLSSLQLNGALRETRVWSRALSASELITFASQKLTGSETGLLTDWPLNQTFGTPAPSIGPQAAPLTVRSAVWSPISLLENGPYFETTVLPSFTGVPGTAGIPGGMHTTVYKNANGRTDILIAYSQYPSTQPYTGDASISAPVLFLRNDGNRSFTAVRPSQPATMVFPRNSAVADFDGDGLEDVIVADHGFDAPPFPGAIPRIFMQRAGAMVDETSSRLPAGKSFTHDACAADVNRDGSPDIFEANLGTSGDVHNPVLLLNDGQGHFRSAPQNLPFTTEGFASCAFVDVNRDGAPDLLLGGNPGIRDWLLLNDGKGNFRDVSAASMPLKLGSTTATSYGFAAGDFNRDGWVDLILTIHEDDKNARMQLLINNGDGTFRNQDDATLNAHIDGWLDKGYVADFNHDGWPDLFVQESGFTARIYQNMGGWFADRTDTLPLIAGAIQYRIADFDGDGMVDVLSTGAQNTIAWGKNLWPAVCSYTVSVGGWTFGGQGGDGSVDIQSSKPDCPWSVSGLPGWVQLTSSSSGFGNGTITFHVNANSGSASATMMVAGMPFTVAQSSGISGLSAAGSLAQVTSQGPWKFTLDAVNLGPASAAAQFTFLDDTGRALPIPVTFPQLPPPLAPLMTPLVGRTINSNAQLVIESLGSGSVPPLVGWGQMASSAGVSGFGIFGAPSLGWNAVVPLEARNAAKYYLAFDNTGSLATGIAIANLATAAANVAVVIRDDSGAQIGTATINLAGQGHTSFMLNAQYAVTAGKRGTVEFTTPGFGSQNAGQISVLGLRANGPALTTLPVLASSDTAGGAIAHATYNGGFTSTFYLVNTGSASASFTLSFFDESGNPLNVPVRLPQTGATSTTAALTQTLVAGAMLVVETVANDTAQSVVGSAQLTTTGNVSGFEIFKWTTFGQEASVPLETRTPGSFVLVFDDTNGLTTGVALSNVAPAAAAITAKIYDDAGTLLQTAAVNLAGRGHTSFLLPSTYAVTSNRRGMVEFVVPAGGKINAVGLRAKSDGTLTTIPVLTK